MAAGIDIARDTVPSHRFCADAYDAVVAYPDVAAAHHSEIAEAEQLVLRVAQGPCAGAAGV